MALDKNLKRHMAKAVETRPNPISLFMAFFQGLDVHSKEIVEFDAKDYDNGVAPFVNPLKDGKPVEIKGYNNNILKLPTMKPVHPITGDDLKKKPFGQTVYTDEQVANMNARNLMVSAIDDNEDRIDRRLEIMRIEAIFDGKLTIVGEGEDREVNFGRAASHTIDLGAGSYWDEVGGDTAADVTDFIKLLGAAGYSATHMVGRSETMDAAVKKLGTELDTRRVNTGDVQFKSMLSVNGAIFYGTYKQIEIWAYDGNYKDATGTQQKAVPAKRIALIGAQNQNEMSYGYSQDPVIEGGFGNIEWTVSPRNVIHKLIPNRSSVEVESVLTGAPLLKSANCCLTATVLV